MKKLLLCLLLVGQYGIIHTARYTQEQMCRDLVKRVKDFVNLYKKFNIIPSSVQTHFKIDEKKVMEGTMLPSEFIEKHGRFLSEGAMIEDLMNQLKCEEFDWFNDEMDRLEQQIPQ